MGSSVALRLLSYSLILMSLVISGSLAQLDTSVCPAESAGNEKLPKTFDSFHVTMTTGTTIGNFVGQLSLMVDKEAGRSSVTVQRLESDDEDYRVIFDTAADQILLIDRLADKFKIDNCVVTSGAEQTRLMHKVAYANTDRMIPSDRLLTPRPEERIDKTMTNLNGAQATLYSACYYDSNARATVGVQWWYRANSDSLMQIVSRYKFSGSSTTQEVTYRPTPVKNMTEKHDATRHPMTAPQGVYCKNMVTSKKAPEPNSRFAFTIEEFVGILSDLPPPLDQPYNMRESYDQRSNITLMEGDAALFFAKDNGKYGAGRVAKVNDFTRGISYIKNFRYGNCSFDKIDMDGWDVNKTPGGPRLKAPGDFFLPSRNELQYKGTGVYRDTEVDIYIGWIDNYIDIGDGKKYPLTLEYYLQIKTSYDMQGNPQYEAIPRGVYATVPPPLRIYTMTDVFDFNTGLPRPYDHDVSDCFGSTQVLHFQLILTTAEIEDENHIEYLSSQLDAFLYSLVNTLAQGLNISPLRIFQPKVSLFADQLFLVEVTISDRANVPNYTPKMPEARLEEVEPKLTELISKKTLIVPIVDGDIAFEVPIKDFVQMDSRAADNNNNRGSQGLSAGAAAGLSIGMILLGALLAVLAMFGISYFRKDPLFGFKPFSGADAGGE